MGSYQKVLVGTDGSASSLRAVERAARLAADVGAELVLASAYRPLSPREEAVAGDELGELAYKVRGSTPAEDALREAEGHAQAAGATRIVRRALEGDPVDVLVDLSAAEGVDLLVVGNRGLNSLAGRLLGSVPQNVSHRARCDVLIVFTTA